MNWWWVLVAVVWIGAGVLGGLAAERKSEAKSERRLAALSVSSGQPVEAVHGLRRSLDLFSQQADLLTIANALQALLIVGLVVAAIR